MTAFALGNGRLTLLLVVLVTIGGLVSFRTLPSREDPDITIRTAQVVAEFPGLSPERVELLITRPLEEVIKEIPEVDKITSSSQTGRSTIQVTLHDRYFDLEPIWADLRNRMTDAASKLPDGTRGPFVNDDYGRVASATLTLHGDGFTLAELRQVARDLRDTLAALAPVSRVELFGIQEERVWIESDPAVLLQLGLPPQTIVQALKGQNIVLPGGFLEADGQRIVIEPSGNFESVQQIADLTIAVPNSDGVVYLRDVAQVTRGYVDPPVRPVFYNGKPAVALGVSMVSGLNIADFGAALTAAVERGRRALPLGLQLDFATYQPKKVDVAVDEAAVNLYQTIAIVFIVVVAFLGLRAGAIVGAIVPLTICLSLLIMSVAGIELHRVSIAAIIISLGLLVDNGIVVAEDIQRRIEAGTPRREAAILAGNSLRIPLLTSTLTTILAFMPLMLAENVSGEFLRSLGQVIIITLLGSWFLALTVTPTLCAWLLPEGTGKPDGESYKGRAYDAYRFLLERFLRMRLLFVGLMVGLFALSVAGFGLVVVQFMPASDRNQYVVTLDLPAGVDIRETAAAAQQLTRWLADTEANPEIKDAHAYVGSGGPRFFLTLNPLDPVPHKAFVIVNTLDDESVKGLLAKTERYVAENIPGARARAQTLFLGPAESGTVEFRVSGPDIAGLRRLARDITGVFRDVPGMAFIRDDWENPILKVRIEIDQARARRAGVTSEDVARALSGQLDGIKVTDYRDGDTVIPVVGRAPETERGDLGRLRTTTVLSSQLGVPVPLLQIADFRGVVEPNQIRRYDQRRTVIVTGKHRTLQAAQLHDAVAPRVAALDLPPGYDIAVGGELENAAKSNAALLKYMPHCLFAIVVLLVWQFNSFRRPAIIALTIPLILIGAVAGLLGTGAFFSFTAMLGLFSLAGIIINNAIVLIDRIEQGRAESDDIDGVIVEAALARARPILMTTLTTILGLMPLILFGGAFWEPMGIVIASGLAVGTVLTLGFVPVLYSLFFRTRWRWRLTPQR